MIRIAAALALLGNPQFIDVQATHDQHDPGHWYEMDCCDLQDCKPASEWSAEVEYLEDGVKITYGGESVVLDYSDEDRVRPSRDFEAHMCIVQGDHVGDWYVRCFYYPGGV